MNEIIEPGRFEVPATTSNSTPLTPMAMLGHAVARGATVDELDRLISLQERIEKNEARKAFDAAISAAKAEIKPIVKNREVDFTSDRGRTNYKYEGLGQIADAVDPILAKHGLSYRHRSRQEGTKLFITCKITHRDGHYEETELSATNDDSGNKNGIQGIGSTATYLQRYTLKIGLGLAATIDDDGKVAGGTPNTINIDQADELDKLLAQPGQDKVGFLQHFKIDDVLRLPASRFNEAKQAINARAQANRK